MKRLSIAASALCLVLGAPACKSSEGTKADPSTAKTASADSPPETEPQAAQSAPRPPKPDESGITWIENDFDAAMKQATDEGKPLVIDMWADWCHTCLSMKKGTLRDAGLAAISKDFVWLSLDTENPSSAEAMAKFPPKVWPTFFVVSPADASVQASQLGSCSVADFREFVLRGGQGHLAALEAGGALKPNSALGLLRAGDRAWMQDDYKAAAKHFAAARKAGGENWGPAATTLKNEIAALSKLESKKPCAELAVAELPRMAEEHNSSGTDFMYYASDCAEALDAPAAEQLRNQTLKAMRGILLDDNAALSADDRSDALATSRGIANAIGSQDLAATLALQQRAVLEAAVKEAATPLEEMTYVWHLVEVNEYLGKGHSILPWVESLEARLPQEYDPPYRRAWLLLKLKRYADAHEPIDRAKTLTKGARLGQILELEAAIYNAEGNSEKEREVRAAIVAHYEGLATGLAAAKKLTKARQDLAAMDAKAASETPPAP